MGYLYLLLFVCEVFLKNCQYIANCACMAVIAFDLCIVLMDREEKCELVSDAQYAYGELGRYVLLYSDCVILLLLGLSL